MKLIHYVNDIFSEIRHITIENDNLIYYLNEDSNPENRGTHKNVTGIVYACDQLYLKYGMLSYYNIPFIKFPVRRIIPTDQTAIFLDVYNNLYIKSKYNIKQICTIPDRVDQIQATESKVYYLSQGKLYFIITRSNSTFTPQYIDHSCKFVKISASVHACAILDCNQILYIHCNNMEMIGRNICDINTKLYNSYALVNFPSIKEKKWHKIILHCSVIVKIWDDKPIVFENNEIPAPPYKVYKYMICMMAAARLPRCRPSKDIRKYIFDYIFT